MTEPIYIPSELFPPTPDLGEWMDPDTQSRCFADAWEGLQSRFFKLETLPYYDEQSNPLVDAWKRGDLETVRTLARAQARKEADDPVEQRIEVVRLRVLRMPISDYVKMENELYRELVAVGEKILGVEHDRLPSDLKECLLDFLLFDEEQVFVHEYDSVGVRLGSWRVKDRIAIRSYREVAERLLACAEPFSHLFAARAE